MATNVTIKLDKRSIKADGTSPLVLSVFHGQTIRISTGLSAAPGEWNDAAGVIHGSTPTIRANNARLRHLLSTAEALILSLSVSGELRKMSCKELKLRLCRELNIGSDRSTGTTLINYLERARRGKSERTQNLFYYTQKRVRELVGDRRIEDVDERWLEQLRDMMQERYAPNTVRQDITRIGRAITLAMEDGVVTRNPCRAIKKPRAVVRKKALSLKLLRELRDAELPPGAMRLARDMFMLQFYLLGINIADIYDARELVDGRLEYARHKTGTLYSVKVMPEAMEIIERLRGDGRLIDLPYKTHTTAVSSLTGALQRIGIVPGLSTNWARHTWATMAAELELPIETISHALGHQIGSPVTAIYVAYNQKKIDEANRRVIDYVNADL